MDTKTKLIYGKNEIDRVVSVEVDEELVYLYRELEDGSIVTETMPNKFWMLSHTKLDSSWVRMKGNLHFKWGKQFTNRRDFNSARQRLKKQDVYSVYNAEEAMMLKDGVTYFSNMTPDDVSVLSFDIESYGLMSNSHKEIYMISNTFRRNGKITKKLFSVDNFYSEQSMLEAWLSWVTTMNPSVMLGHNIFGYDLPYIKACCNKYHMDMNIGRDGSTIKFDAYESTYRVDGSTAWEYRSCNIHGREIVDTMFLAVKYDVGRNFPTWGLKPIIKHLGLEKEDREFYDAATIKDNWSNPVEREKIKKYGEDDSDDALALYDIMIPAYFYTSQSLCRTFQKIICSATGAWINGVLVRSYLQNQHSVPKASERGSLEGGMSYGIPGVYKNVTKWDADSYYPSTILTFGIYPEEKDPDQNYLKMVEFFTTRRFEQKDLFKQTGNKLYDDQQAASKIFINSSYGVLGTGGLNFNDFEKASLITRCCRAGLQKSIVWATGKDVSHWWPEYAEGKTSVSDFKDFSFIDEHATLKFDDMERNDWILVNLDTDSLSFAKKDHSAFTDDELVSIETKLNEIMYSHWGDDGYFDNMLISKAKNYVMKERGSDELKYKGSSFKDSKKEPALKQMMKDLVDSLIFTKGNEVDIFERYIRMACDIDDINNWAIKKSITQKLLTSERTNESKVRDAFKGREFQEGEKIFVFNSVDGLTQLIRKGEPIFYKKTGEPKMIPNTIISLVEDYKGSYDKEHYVRRVYKTLKILENVLDLTKFERYDTVKGMKILKEGGLI